MFVGDFLQDLIVLTQENKVKWTYKDNIWESSLIIEDEQYILMLKEEKKVLLIYKALNQKLVAFVEAFHNLWQYNRLISGIKMQCSKDFFNTFEKFIEGEKKCLPQE